MKQYRVGRYIVLSIIGFVIFGAGLVLLKLLPDTDGILKTLPYICVGVGAGVFGGNIGTVIQIKIALKNPQVAKQAEIEEKDERNRAISNKAKAKTYDLMIFVYTAMLFTFALMAIDMYVILTLVGVYLFFISSYVYYLTKYHKIM